MEHRLGDYQSREGSLEEDYQAADKAVADLHNQEERFCPGKKGREAGDKNTCPKRYSLEMVL